VPIIGSKAKNISKALNDYYRLEISTGKKKLGMML
jgi:hypothetical protein